MIETRREEVGEIYRALQDLDRDLRRSDPRWATLSYPAPISAPAARSLLGPDVALLSYLLGPDESFLFVLTDRELEVLPLPGEAALQSLVQELRRLLETPSRRSLGRFARVSRELYALLIEPAESLIDDRKRLIVVPDGPLHYLPFEALLSDDSATSSPAALRNAYLISRWSVSYAPSVSVLSSLRSRAPAVAGHRRRLGRHSRTRPSLARWRLPAPVRCSAVSVISPPGAGGGWQGRGQRCGTSSASFRVRKPRVFLDDQAGERAVQGRERRGASPVPAFRFARAGRQSDARSLGRAAGSVGRRHGRRSPPGSRDPGPQPRRRIWSSSPAARPRSAGRYAARASSG